MGQDNDETINYTPIGNMNMNINYTNNNSNNLMYINMPNITNYMNLNYYNYPMMINNQNNLSIHKSNSGLISTLI